MFDLPSHCIRQVALAAALLGGLVLAVPAQDIPSTQVEFPKGSSGTVIVGALRGRNPDARDYLLGAKAGQTLTVSLQTASNATYFNVLAPGSNGEALFAGETAARNSWQGTLPADGDYTVRVYLNRAASRQGASANYKLTVSIAGGEPAAAGAEAGAASSRYDATGQLPCAMGGMPAGSMQCNFGIKRSGPGKAVVDISTPGGVKRSLIFSGKHVSAGSNASVKALLRDDEWSVDVNDYEHYVVPQTVINGG